jgi:hypothetical protein
MPCRAAVALPDRAWSRAKDYHALEGKDGTRSCASKSSIQPNPPAMDIVSTATP